MTLTLDTLEQAPAGDGLYLLHLEPAYWHAGHYLGWAGSIRSRLRVHLTGAAHSSPLLRAQLAAGGSLVLARTWAGETRTLESTLKRRHYGPRLCPICRGRRDNQ